MDSENKKREVHPLLKQLLDVDVQCTKWFVMYANNFLPLRSLRIHYKMLEVSCHGIPWFAFWLAFTWLFNNPSLVQMQVNMLFGLFLDIMIVATLKAFVRRRRPVANTDDMLGQLGPDKFSFPSGHASRAVYAAFFFINLYPLPIYFWPTLIVWASSVCISRILLCRHHILDVLVGASIGVLEGLILCIFWIPEDTAMWLMSYLSDEKLDGGSYHV